MPILKVYDPKSDPGIRYFTLIEEGGDLDLDYVEENGEHISSILSITTEGIVIHKDVCSSIGLPLTKEGRVKIKSKK